MQQQTGSLHYPIWRGGGIEINGYQINKELAKIKKTGDYDFKSDWPGLEETIYEDVLKNNFTGQVDVIVGQDNLWRIVLNKIIIHPSQEFGAIKTKLGWTLGGKVSVIYSENNLKNIDVYYNHSEQSD